MLGQSGSLDITKHTWARVADRCDATGGHINCTHQVLPKQSKKKKLISVKRNNPTLENHPESLLNEAISLISIDNSSVKLTRKWWALTKKVVNSFLFLSGSASPAEIIKWELHYFRVPIHNAMTCKMATVLEIMSRASPSKWLVRSLSIKGKVCPAVEQDSSLTQNRLTFRVMANLTDASGTSIQSKRIPEAVH